MDETRFQIAKTAAVVLAIFVTVLLQWRLPLVKARGLVLRNWRANVPLALVNIAVTAIVCGACVCALAQYLETADLSLTKRLGLPMPARIIATVVLLDLTAYAWHRANHVWPFLWRFHRVHHSDEVYDASTAIRFHPGEICISLVVRLLVVAAFGLPVVGILAFEALFALANTFEHGNIRLPDRLSRAMETVFVTPAMHRLHHSPNRRHTNSNYATIFSVWDRLFGSMNLPGGAREAGAVGLGMPEVKAFDSRALLAMPFRRL